MINTSRAVRLRLVQITTVPLTLQFFRGQAAFLRRFGIETTAVSSPGPLLDCFRRNEGIEILEVPMRRAISPIADIKAIARMIRILRVVRPDIVHAHTPKAGLLAMIAAVMSTRALRCYTVHGLPHETASGVARFLLMMAEALSCRIAHKVFCVSESVRSTLEGSHLCPSGKARVLQKGSISGVDALHRFKLHKDIGSRTRARLGISPRVTVIGFVGRLVEDKGISDLMAAWDLLRARCAPVHLLLVGPFEARDGLSPELLRRIRESRDITVHEDYEMPPVYAAMDVVVLPSYREGFPVVPLEAAAMRLPVVATEIPPNREAVENKKTGLLVPPHAPELLAAALEQYVCDPALRSAHGVAGRDRVLAQFQPERIWNELAAEYLRATKRDAGYMVDPHPREHQASVDT